MFWLVGGLVLQHILPCWVIYAKSDLTNIVSNTVQKFIFTIILNR